MAYDVGRRLRRIWPWIAGGLVLVVLVVQAVRPTVQEVEVARVARGPLQVSLDEEGRTRWRDTFVVTAPVGGTVSRITLEPGDRVTAGDVIATVEAASAPLLDTRTREELQAQLEAARAALGRARAEEAAAQAEARQVAADLARARPLAKVGAVAPATVEDQELRVQTAEERRAAASFAVRVAGHQVEAAQAALRIGRQPATAREGATVTVRAPIDGVILKRMRVSASIVPPGEPLVEIGAPATLEIIADYLSTDAVQLRAGLPVQVVGWGQPEAVLPATVRRIEPGGFTKVSALGVEEQRVNVVMAPEGPREAWADLGDGYRVETQVVVWSADDVVTVPFGSVFRDGDAWAVFVVRDDRAERRRVRIGHQTATAVEVVEGLEAGDTVIVHPGDQIADGAAVRPREDA